MKLKCVGGPNDGEWHEAPEGNKQGNYVRLYQHQNVEVSIDEMNRMLNNPYSISEEITVKYVIYQVHKLHFVIDYVENKFKEVVFLGYQNMSLLELVEH